MFSSAFRQGVSPSLVYIETWPWWPGVIFEPDDAGANPDALQKKTAAQIKKDRLHLVRFYDNVDSWCVPSPFLPRLFGRRLKD